MTGLDLTSRVSAPALPRAATSDVAVIAVGAGNARTAAPSRRANFTAEEMGGIVAALAPLAGAEADPRALAGVVSALAERRSRGEATMLVVVSPPGGGTAVSVMSPGEFAAAVTSDDPNSLGSVTTDDGQTTALRDLVREALTDGDGREHLPPAQRLAAALAEQMAAANGEAPREEARDAGGKDIAALARDLAPAERKSASGTTVSILALPARAVSGTAGAALLDVTA